MISHDSKKGDTDFNENGTSVGSDDIDVDVRRHDVGSDAGCFKRTLMSFCGSNKKWIVIRFGMIFLISVIILCCVYGLKSTSKHKNTAK